MQPATDEVIVEKEIESVNDSEEAVKKSIQDFMADPKNSKFVQEHAWTGKWRSHPSKNNVNIVAFKKTDSFDDQGDKPGGKRASPLRNGGTYTNYMKSTNYGTNVSPGPGSGPAPVGATGSQGLWRSYHA